MYCIYVYCAYLVINYETKKLGGCRGTKKLISTYLGERNDECEKYKDVPQCFQPCPAKCEQSFKVSGVKICVVMTGVTRTRSVTPSARGSRPPPSCPAATTRPAPRSAWTRPPPTSAPDRYRENEGGSHRIKLIN